MAKNKAQVEINIIGDASSAKKAMEELTLSAQGFGAKMASIGKVAAGAMTGFLAADAVKAGGHALLGLRDQAASLELQMKKANTVFGDQIGVVQDWAKANAASMGLTTNQATNLAAGLQDLLVPMGFTREAATDLSTKTIGLAGALAEWSGGQKDAAEVAEILQSAYLGETDGLKALGISISAADVQARLAAKGQDKLTGAAQQQAQALAIQELIFEKSTDAQAAFAKGSDSAARKQAEMTAKFEQAKEQLAVGLMPVFGAATTLLANGLVPAATLVGRVVEGLSPTFTTVGAVVGDFGRYIGAVITDGDTLNDWLTHLPEPLQGVAQGFGGVTMMVQGLIAFLQNPALPTLGDLSGKVATATMALGEHQTAISILTPVVGALAAMYATYRAVQLGATAAAWAQNAVTVALRAPTIALTAAQGALNAVMLANPFVLVTVLLAGLVAGLIVAYKTSETFRDIVNGAWQGIQSNAAFAVNWFNTSFIPFFTTTIPGAFGQLWDALLRIGGGIQSAITAPFEKAKEIVQPIIDTLGGWIDKVKGWIGGIGGAGFMGIMGNVTPGAGPVPGGVFTQGFGVTSFSGNYASGHHTGFDYAAPAGSPIYATRAGRVSLSGWYDGYGNAVIEDIGPGLQLLYGHMSKIIAGAGQFVRAGQLIGLVGSTGFSTGPHVHFEARKNGVAINPAAFLADGGLVTEPTLAWLGETPRARPEIASPVPLLRKIIQEELAAAFQERRAPIYNVTFNTTKVTDDDVYRALRRLDYANGWRG